MCPNIFVKYALLIFLQAQVTAYIFWGIILQNIRNSLSAGFSIESEKFNFWLKNSPWNIWSSFFAQEIFNEELPQKTELISKRSPNVFTFTSIFCNLYLT